MPRFYNTEDAKEIANYLIDHPKELDRRIEKSHEAGEDADLYGLEGIDETAVLDRIRRSEGSRRAKLVKDFEVPEFMLDNLEDSVRRRQNP